MHRDYTPKKVSRVVEVRRKYDVVHNYEVRKITVLFRAIDLDDVKQIGSNELHETLTKVVNQYRYVIYGKKTIKTVCRSFYLLSKKTCVGPYVQEPSKNRS